MQDNKANSIANVPTGLLSTTPNQQQATHLTATTQEEMTKADYGYGYSDGFSIRDRKRNSWTFRHPRCRLKWIMDVFADKVYNPKLKRQEVFFDKNYNTIIDLYSYGHDIETAWLMDRGVEVLGDDHYKEKMSPITETLAENVYEVAFEVYHIKKH